MFYIVPVKDSIKYDGVRLKYANDNDTVYILDTEDCSLEPYTISQIKQFPASVKVENFNVIENSNEVRFECLTRVWHENAILCSKHLLMFRGNVLLMATNSTKEYSVSLVGTNFEIGEISTRSNCTVVGMYMRYAQSLGELVHLRICLMLKNGNNRPVDILFSAVLNPENGKLVGLFDFVGAEIITAEVKGEYIPSKSFLAKLKVKNDWR